VINGLGIGCHTLKLSFLFSAQPGKSSHIEKSEIRISREAFRRNQFETNPKFKFKKFQTFCLGHLYFEHWCLFRVSPARRTSSLAGGDFVLRI
jgi:hypothetical protein